MIFIIIIMMQCKNKAVIVAIIVTRLLLIIILERMVSSYQVDQYFLQAYHVSLKRCTKDVSNTAGTRMGMHCPGRVFRGWC